MAELGLAEEVALVCAGAPTCNNDSVAVRKMGRSDERAGRYIISDVIVTSNRRAGNLQIESSRL